MKDKRSGRIERIAPGLALLTSYPRSWIRADSLASLSLWAVLVPQALAYAQIAGLKPVTGLYSALAMMLFYAVFGTSRYLNVGPESGVAILVASSVALLPDAKDPAHYAALVSMMAILAGGFLLVGYLVRAGAITRLLSSPVLTGFLAGSAIVIMIDQLPKILGFDVSDEEYPSVVVGLVSHLERTNFTSLAIGVGTAALVLILNRVSRRIPAALVGMVLATLIVVVGGLADQVDTVGKVSAGLPGLAIPAVGLKDVRDLLLPALSAALLIFSGSIITARALAAKDHEDIDANREFVGLAVANIGSGVFGGFPGGASDSRSFLVAESGGKSQMVGYISAVLVVVTLLFLTPLLSDIPNAALGGVILATAIGLIDVKGMRHLRRVHRTDFALMGITLASVLFFGVLPGILVGVFASLIAMVRRTITPSTAVLGVVAGTATYRDVSNFDDAETIPGLVVYRFDAPLFFGNADMFRDEIRGLVDGARLPVSYVIVNAEGVTDLDTTGIGVLERLLDDLDDRGTGLAFARLRSPLLELFRISGLEARIGPDHFFLRIEDAVEELRPGGSPP